MPNIMHKVEALKLPLWYVGSAHQLNVGDDPTAILVSDTRIYNVFARLERRVRICVVDGVFRLPHLLFEIGIVQQNSFTLLFSLWSEQHATSVSAANAIV